MARRDLTQVADNNPTRVLADHLAELGEIEDADLLRIEAMRLVGRCSSISEANRRKFCDVITRQKRDRFSVLKYITDFVLAGAGLAVSRGAR